MSWLTFIASDYPLEAVVNPHIKLLSINEALEKGRDFPEWVLNPDIDKNKPNVCLWVDKKENLGEISIRTTNKNLWSDELPTTLKYCSILEWHNSEARANKLIAYVRKHLEIADKIEVCQFWNSDIKKELTKKICNIQIENLMPTDFEKMSEYDFYCVVITRI